MQHGHIKLPRDAWKIAPGTVIEAEDLLSDETYLWRDEWTYVRLDPTMRVAHVLSITSSPIANV
jgi:hypothetical protein